MRTETTMAAAMKKAGMHTAGARLHALALDILAGHGGDPKVATYDFTAAVTREADLLVELISRPEILRAAVDYLRAVANGAPETPGGKRGQLQSDTHHVFAPPPGPRLANGGGQIGDATQMRLATPVREPSPGQLQAAARVARQMAETVLDSFRVRDGRAIGDVPVAELERIRATNVREAALLRLVQKAIGGGYVPEGIRVRDLVTAETMERLVQKAAEVADAA